MITDGTMVRCWINQSETMQGRALDLHSISFMHYPAKLAGCVEPPIHMHQVYIPQKGDPSQMVWSSNLGLLTTEDLRTLRDQIDQHLAKIDAEDD